MSVRATEFDRFFEEVEREVESARDETTADGTQEPATEWAVVEVYGHRRHAGRIVDHERFGAKMLRVDVPTIEIVDGAAQLTGWTTHFYGGGAIFSMTPTDEATVMRMNRPYAPASRYSLPAPDDGADDDERSWADL